MIVGIDVYYDDKHAGILYGALVASINKTHTRYFSCSDQCANNEELSEYFKKNIISECIILYYFESFNIIATMNL